MNRRRIIAVVGPAVVLATPSICHAHAVHPVYFGLGPLSLMIPFSNPPHSPKVVVCCLLFLGVIGAQSVILHFMIPGEGTFGNLWRATVAFATGKVAESVCLLAIGLIGPLLFPWLAWSLESWEVVYVVPILMFGAGVFATASLIRILVRKEQHSRWQTIRAALVLNSVAYGVLQVAALGMMKAHWVW
ncbi:MAG: hypothetical protein ACYC0X_00035 [Pirellulaceae bacterium]